MKRLLVATLGLFLSGVLKAESVVIAEPIVPIDEKVVELHITFAPPTTAAAKKVRKLMMKTKTGQAVCSGSFVSSVGHILTAKHCADGASEIIAVTSDGQEYTATIREMSQTQDLAVLQIGKFGSPYFKLASRSVVRGEPVALFGSPLGLTGMLTQGIVSKLGGDNTFMDVTALPGSSGGPVLNVHGELVGVVSAMIIVYLGPSHISVAVSLDAIRMFFYEASGGR